MACPIVSMTPEDAAEMGVTDLQGVISRQYDDPPPIIRDYTTTRWSQDKLVGGRLVRTRHSGTPEYVNHPGHEVDNHWAYPVLQTDVLGNGASRTDYIAARNQ